MNEDQILGIKELIQTARRKGKVLPVSCAFEMYPVEDEEHKGKIEYWKREEINCRLTYDIVFLGFLLYLPE